MTRYGQHPPLKVAADPHNPVWHWFLFNGPHGEQFNWHKSSVAPRQIETLRKFIEQISEENPDFPAQAREVALQALENDDFVVIRTGIQVLAVLGTETDLQIVASFLDHPDKEIVKDARCCLFERGVKLKRK